jgi:ComEC/Rec2-related protein
MARPVSVAARPLAWLALAAIIGITIAHLCAEVVTPWIWLGAGTLGVTASFWWGKSWQLLAATALVCGFWHAADLQKTLQHPLYHTLHARQTALDVVADGWIVKPLRRDLPGTQPGQALFVADSVHAPLLGKQWTGRAEFRVRLAERNRPSDKDQDPAPGRCHLEGRVMLAPPADNPGQFDERDFDLRHGLVAEFRPTKMEVIALDRWNLWAALDHGAEFCREWVKSTLSTGINNDEARTVVLATVLGGAEAHARDLEQPFRVTGTLHIFAVAGLHVGIVALILKILLTPLRLSRRALTVMLILAVFGYSFITGLRPSTMRAAVMVSVFLSGEFWNRRSDMLNSMGAAALLILIWDTNQLLSVGFQLSFGVITSIALLHQRFMNLFGPWAHADSFLPQPLLNRTQRSFQWLRLWLARAICISAASWIGSLPFTIGHFHLATPIALAANLVLVPVAFLVLFTSVLSLVFAMAHIPWAPMLLGNANFAFGRFAIFAAHAFAAIPGGNFFLSDPSLTLRAPAEITVLRLRAGGAAQEVRVRHEHWLLDAGAEKDYDFLLHPFLNDAGVNQLDGLILSHGSFEHAGGALKLLKDYHPEHYFLSAAEDSNRAARSSTLGKLRAQGVNFQPMRQSDTIDFGPHGSSSSMQLVVLFPPASFKASRTADRALIARLDSGPFRILWSGDAGFNTEKALLASHPEALRCDVLIRNQRADDDFALLPEFLDATRPRVVISSNNRFPDTQKLPERIRSDCQKRNITLIDQAESGAVQLRLWPQRLEIHPFRGGNVITLVPQKAEAPH